MIRSFATRGRLRAVKPAAPRKAYTVLIRFAYKHVMREAGTVLELTDAEAKYHLLAKRITPVTAKASAIAPAVPAALPEIVESDDHDGLHDGDHA